MNQFEILGQQLEVRQIAGSAYGSLSPLVFLHEGLGSVSSWVHRAIDWPQEVCDATGRAGVVYSRRGYGLSEPVPDVRGAPCESRGQRSGRLLPDYLHREAWDVLPALLEKLQISSPILIGHSDGATIALLHASRYPVAGCVAMAPHVIVEDIAVLAITQAKAAFQSGGLRERLARHHANVDCAFWQWNDIWLSPAFRSMDIREECRNISCPLLLIQGLDDEYGTMRQLDEIALAIPHPARMAQLRLAACGHSPHRDQPGRTLEAVAAFLLSVA